MNSNIDNYDIDNELIEKCLDGNQEAWNEFYSTYYNVIRRIAAWRKWSFIEPVVEEIVQEVFFDLIKGLKAFKGQSSLLTYVQRITKNKCISALRKETTLKRKADKTSISYEEVKYKSTSDLDKPLSPSPLGKPEDNFLKQEESRILRACVEQLSDKCKEIVTLRYYSDLSYTEIGEKLSLPEGTVCSRLKRCLLHLSKIYKEMSSGFNVKR